MFYGAIIFRFIGTLVRWLFKGFQLSFKRVWEGPPYDDPADLWAYVLISNAIGALTLLGIILFFK